MPASDKELLLKDPEPGGEGMRVISAAQGRNRKITHSNLLASLRYIYVPYLKKIFF